jgi:hypothetical protein
MNITGLFFRCFLIPDLGAGDTIRVTSCISGEFRRPGPIF